MNPIRRAWNRFQPPLVATPQGWVALLSALVYGLLAVGFWGFDIALPVSASRASTGAFCVGWPIVVLFMFVSDGAPGFEASWPRAALLALVAATPLAVAAYRWTQ